MSVLSRHRFFLGCALLLMAQAVFADNPTASSGARMAFMPTTGHIIMFGGETTVDAGTRLAYNLSQTWEWIGTRWVQIYPAHSPAARAQPAMVYDSAQRKIVMFGGRYVTIVPGTSVLKSNQLNDTWVFDGQDWSQVPTATAPPARLAAAAAYDPVRNKTVLFGGSVTELNSVNTVTTVTNFYDTWEFDGQNWTETSTSGPQMITPMLAYDESRGQMILVGTDPSNNVKMYSYNAGDKTWESLAPATLPDCVASANMVYQSHDQKIVLYGGLCSTSSTLGDTWEWDGTTWTKITSTILRATGEAMAYDSVRQQTVMFGGTIAFGLPQSVTYIYRAHLWSAATATESPAPRSLFGFTTNPADGSVWLYSGLNENGNLDEFWKYQNGTWSTLPLTDGPGACVSPNVAYDSDRAKLVVVCADSTLFEWDGSVWTQAKNLKTTPPARRFSSMTYDPSLKKVILFGGYDDTAFGYIDQTWQWDGTSWVRQKNNPPPRRSLSAMWFDPVLNKTVLFGGIGQTKQDAKIERFNDMWSFDGKGWSQITLSGTVPSPRYGMQYTVDPQTHTLLMFGGLRLETSGVLQTQVFANDTWQWDGSKWTELHPATVPVARENGGMAFDPSTNEIVMFGGYTGYYLSDLWGWTGSDWTLRSASVPAPSNIRRIGPH